jgi:hypothetical protein
VPAKIAATAVRWPFRKDDSAFGASIFDQSLGEGKSPLFGTSVVKIFWWQWDILAQERSQFNWPESFKSKRFFEEMSQTKK